MPKDCINNLGRGRAPYRERPDPGKHSTISYLASTQLIVNIPTQSDYNINTLFRHNTIRTSHLNLIHGRG